MRCALAARPSIAARWITAHNSRITAHNSSKKKTKHTNLVTKRMPLTDVLSHVVRHLNLGDLQALACCQRQLVSNVLVEQRFEFTGSNLLRLLAIVKKSNLLCHDCYKRPVAHIGNAKRRCARCDKCLCQPCCRHCSRGEACRGFQLRVMILCGQCARSSCSVQGCQICNCFELHRCACAALICVLHQRLCALCSAVQCPDCAVKHCAALGHQLVE